LSPPRATSFSGADVQNRTGDLVLTKDALCQLSYIGLRLRLRPTSRPSHIPFPTDQSACLSVTASNAGLPAVARGSESSRERRLERETGIEPATNSLEGCDSTTELLPPTRRTASPSWRFGGQARPLRGNQFTDTFGPSPPRLPTEFTRCLASPPLACQPKLAPSSRERRLVAREGLEPSKPLGRQIYSLLRLTASLPRQLFC
jgi:hypothetical protein